MTTSFDRLRMIHALDQLDAAVEQTLGPQCRTVSAARVRCVLNRGHDGRCDVRPWRRPT